MAHGSWSKKRNVPPKKGILFTNPVVAGHIGAALGSLAIATYVEKPDILDQVAPIVAKLGRIYEREDVICYLTAAARKSRGHDRQFIEQIAATLRTGIHEEVGKAHYGSALEREIDTVKQMYGMQEWTRATTAATKPKKGKRR